MDFWPVSVEPRDSLKIWLEFNDGVSGELDMSHLKGKGVFKAWDDREFFKRVHVNDYNVVSWGFTPNGVELDFSPETMYARLLGLSLDEISKFSDPESFYAEIEKRQSCRRLAVSTA